MDDSEMDDSDTLSGAVMLVYPLLVEKTLRKELNELD
jgi:hypothetical protein